LEEVTDGEDKEILQRMVEGHVRFTGSELARKMLADWANCLPRFKKIMPRDYRRVLEERKLRGAEEQVGELEVAPHG
jgi:glutamate synthase domain-containing protein 3